MKEYNDRNQKPLVNPPVTDEEYEENKLRSEFEEVTYWDMSHTERKTFRDRIADVAEILANKL